MIKIEKFLRKSVNICFVEFWGEIRFNHGKRAIGVRVIEVLPNTESSVFILNTWTYLLFTKLKLKVETDGWMDILFIDAQP